MTGYVDIGSDSQNVFIKKSRNLLFWCTCVPLTLFCNKEKVEKKCAEYIMYMEEYSTIFPLYVWILYTKVCASFMLYMYLFIVILNIIFQFNVLIQKKKYSISKVKTKGKPWLRQGYEHQNYAKQKNKQHKWTKKYTQYNTNNRNPLKPEVISWWVCHG